MKAVLTKKNLLEGVRTAGHAISGRSSLPILSHVLLSAQDGEVRLSATDLQVGISLAVPAEVIEPGQITIGATIAADVISALPDADVTVESNEHQHVRITCPPADYQIVGLAPNEFPGLPEVPDDIWLEIEAKDLRAGLKRTSFACSTDELRTILLGVLFRWQGDTLTLVATDTHRLAVDTRMVGNGMGNADAVVPSRVVNELLRILTDDGKVRIHISEGQIMFTYGGVILSAILIEGQFPNYERVIPAEFDKKLTMPVNMFSPAVKRASIVGRADSNRIVVQAVGDRLIVSAKAGGVGEAREEVECIREGEEITIAFNAEYLMNVLDVLDAEGVQIELSQPLSPTVVRPVGSDDYLCVVMPMQLSEGLASA